MQHLKTNDGLPHCATGAGAGPQVLPKCLPLGTFAYGCLVPLTFAATEVGGEVIWEADPNQNLQPVGFTVDSQQAGGAAVLARATYNGQPIYPAAPLAGPSTALQFPDLNIPLDRFSLDGIEAGIHPFPRSAPIINQDNVLRLTFTGVTAASQVRGVLYCVVPFPWMKPGPQSYYAPSITKLMQWRKQAWKWDGLPTCGVPMDYSPGKGGKQPCGETGVVPNGCKSVFRFESEVITTGTTVNIPLAAFNKYAPIGFVTDQGTGLGTVILNDVTWHSKTIYATGQLRTAGNVARIGATTGQLGLPIGDFFNYDQVFAGVLPFPRNVPMITVNEPLVLNVTNLSGADRTVSGELWVQRRDDVEAADQESCTCTTIDELPPGPGDIPNFTAPVGNQGLPPRQVLM